MAAIRNEPRLDDLPTEGRDPAGADLDLRPTRELVRLMGEADATVPHAVAAAGEALAGAIDAVILTPQQELDGVITGRDAGFSGLGVEVDK
jgi:N-acetylmuramic acid 6-phosphate (MurNAc-6-P) etherase